MHLFGFTIQIYYDARPYERQIYMKSSTFFVDKTNPTTGDKMRAEFYVIKRKPNRNSFLKYLTSIATKLTDKWQYSTNDAPYQCQTSLQGAISIAET